ncbi:response regulator transcription factor [Spirilliplanes yamanashiensis]|uniref:Helix-turn-helix transcriptional regulator n=1 Tax=Spirilliplanes yamanashiensis TaxID=42233 RepID=A0A8J4DJD3_9ACTN|nr:response regulator transcription factor [Spirilliplanes yamanashiensis]MDP9815446.1 DNA-binding NarL/FixJ family response regulator [Spirilliplanes yamanashiensis]GIJ03701.1 helix-turn-helix transcriptional regulator [Spirilliplanes yamanashiensis]
MERIKTYIHADDPISRAGVASQLRPRPEVLVVEGAEALEARVCLVIGDQVTQGALRVIRLLRQQGSQVVLVVAELDDSALVASVEAGVAGMVRRCDATPDRLIAAIRSAAAGEAAVPPDLVNRLMDQVGRLQRQVLSPRGLSFTGLADREIEVLRLVADGLDTAEIATKLSYSQRTIKSVLHDVTTRLQLKNRSHAVAYALRQGLI